MLADIHSSSATLPTLMINILTITWQESTIHQVTTMLATSKNVLFPGPNHLLTIGADDLIL